MLLSICAFVLLAGVVQGLLVKPVQFRGFSVNGNAAEARAAKATVKARSRLPMIMIGQAAAAGWRIQQEWRLYCSSSGEDEDEEPVPLLEREEFLSRREFFDNNAPDPDNGKHLAVEDDEESIFNEFNADSTQTEKSPFGDEKVVSEENSLAALEKEREELQFELNLVEALEQRNEAQRDSFVDEDAQWAAQDEGDRRILSKKPTVVACLESIDELLTVLRNAP